MKADELAERLGCVAVEIAKKAGYTTASWYSAANRGSAIRAKRRAAISQELHRYGDEIKALAYELGSPDAEGR